VCGEFFSPYKKLTEHVQLSKELTKTFKGGKDRLGAKKLYLETAKKSPNQETGLGNRGTLEA
jgi:hypothetical protein